MPTTLYDQDGHRCLMFTDLTEEEGEAVQANQFLVVDEHDPAALLTPAGQRFRWFALACDAAVCTTK